MIDSLNEINRVLIAVDKLSHGSKGALENHVLRFCREIVIEGRFPDHKSTIDFSIEMGIITRSGSRLQLTKLGRELLDLNPQLKYELNESQKELLTKNCLLVGKASSQLAVILKQFVPAYSCGTYQWSPIDNTPLMGDPEIVEIMKQSGLLRSLKGIFEVDHRYVASVRDILKPDGFVTLDELALHLRNADIVGRIAESIALNFEKQRLQELGCLAESDCIQKISDLNVAAGYDIASFDGKNLDLVHDRFIEVKGSTQGEVGFYWTTNEMKQAKIHGTKYWIYFIGGVDAKNETSEAPPILIQDPVKNVLMNNEFEVECVQFYARRRNQE